MRRLVFAPERDLGSRVLSVRSTNLLNRLLFWYLPRFPICIAFDSFLDDLLHCQELVAALLHLGIYLVLQVLLCVLVLAQSGTLSIRIRIQRIVLFLNFVPSTTICLIHILIAVLTHVNFELDNSTFFMKLTT